MGKLDKLKSQIPQGSQELSTKNHLAKTEIAMSFQNEGTELTRILLRNIEFNPHNLWSCNDDDESIRQLADAIERNGLLHNIVVSQREDGTFMLLSGERRGKALRLLQKREQESDPTGQKAHKWDRVQAQTYTGLDELSELIILDEANIMVRGLSGDAKTIQACISRYLDNLQAKFQVDRRAAEAYFKSRTQMTDSTVQRYTQFDKSLIDDVKEFFQNGTISHAQALSLCPLEPSEQVLYVNAINKAIQMSNGDKALEHTYVTRITDRAAQAARMTNGREDELARLEEQIAAAAETPENRRTYTFSSRLFNAPKAINAAKNSTETLGVWNRETTKSAATPAAMLRLTILQIFSALPRRIFCESAASSTRPPSSGNAGSRFTAAMEKLENAAVSVKA